MDDENLRSSTFAMGDDNLRGFRRRWSRQSRSDASERLSNISGFHSELSGPPEAWGSILGTDHGSWEAIKSYDAPSIRESDLLDDDQQLGHSQEYGPEPPVDRYV